MKSLAVISFGLIGSGTGFSIALIAPWSNEAKLILGLVWLFGLAIGIGAGNITTGVSK